MLLFVSMWPLRPPHSLAVSYWTPCCSSGSWHIHRRALTLVPLSLGLLWLTQVFEVCSDFTSLKCILNCSIKYCHLPPLAFCSPNPFYPYILSLSFVHSAYYFLIHKWITHFTGVMIVVYVCRIQSPQEKLYLLVWLLYLSQISGIVFS